MAIYKIFIGKNKNKTEERHPDLKVAFMVTNGDDKTTFIECGALWKSKSGAGYTGSIDTEAKPYVKKTEKVKSESEIMLEDCPF